MIQSTHRQQRRYRPTLLAALLHAALLCHGLSTSAAAQVIDAAAVARIDTTIETAIAAGELPGAVLIFGQRDRVLHRKAYGQRAIEPAKEPMTIDTVFDLASLTKVVATASSVMILIDEGKLRLNDRASQFIPEFARHGKRDITIRQLLTHVSGLRGDVDLADPWLGRARALELAADERLQAPPGQRFIYSDIGYFVLGEIVERASGLPFERFVAERVLQPLAMRDTTFTPAEPVRNRIAPTEWCTAHGWPCQGQDRTMLRGVVHDPTARRMQGVAGHAGLFGTADDLARYCRMILRGGELDGRRVLSTLAVTRMTSAATPPGMTSIRGLGWDIDSSYSGNRGDLLPIGSFGHTGFTGTSVWIDPLTGAWIVLLSNRLHPDGKGDAGPLRGRIANLVAAALRALPDQQTLRAARWAGADFTAGSPAASLSLASASSSTISLAAGRTRTGIDMLQAEGFRRLAGKRVGLLTNHTGKARDGSATIDLLARAAGVTLVALFSPEHGIRGELDSKVPSSVDTRTGLVVHSLYGDSRRPGESMLDGIDILVVDLQDIGTRFYTYMTTMGYVMEAAAQRGMSMVILDRPNPIGGIEIEGPGLSLEERSFTAYFPMPIRHGLTLGELARLFDGERQDPALRLGERLTVIPMQHWSRESWFDDTGLLWIDPSPNMRSLAAATLYPGVATIEGANVSVGRGTDRPFELLGAPWIDGPRLAARLNAASIPGLRAYPVTFTPRASKFVGERCGGVALVVTDRTALRPVRLGLEIAAALHEHHGSSFALDAIQGLFGRDTVERIRRGETTRDIREHWAADEVRWRTLRSRYLLY